MPHSTSSGYRKHIFHCTCLSAVLFTLVIGAHLRAQSQTGSAQQDDGPQEQAQPLAERYGLDLQLVAEMLSAGTPAQYINAHSAAVYLQEKATKPQTTDIISPISETSLTVRQAASRQQAAPLHIITLVIDGSSSIDEVDFTTQKEGIISVLSDPVLVPRNGSIAVMVVQYAETMTRLDVPYRLLASDIEANQVITQVGAIVQIGGGTNPGDGINAAAAELQLHATAADRTTICLSTDGLRNSGADVATALANARAATVPLDTFSVIAIEDPPDYFAADFHAFYDSLVFGDGAVSVVRNSLEFAAYVGATCFANEQVALVGLESVQTIQDLQDSVQMIAHKTTYVRVHSQPVDRDTVRVAARLHARRGGSALPGSPLTALNPYYGVDAKRNALARRNQLEQSLYFRLPDEWLTGTIDLTVERIGRAFVCQDEADTPNDCQVTVTFTPVERPEIRFVAVAWTDQQNVVHVPSPADLEELANRVRAIYPIDDLIVSTDETTYNGTLPFTANSLLAVNMQLATMRYNDGCTPDPTCRRLYYGVLKDTLLSGYAFDTVASGNMPAGAIVFGRNRHAHEIAHMLGRSNAVHSSLGLITINGESYKQGWCGERDRAVVPDFPYSAVFGGATVATLGPMAGAESARIFGLDTLRMAVVDPTEHYELMSYCGRSPSNAFRWVSKYSYADLATAINNHFTSTAAQTPAPTAQPQPYRLFRGVVNFATNQVEFLPPVLMTTNMPPQQPPIGDYTLLIKDQTGNQLKLLPFEPERGTADFPQPTEQMGLFILPVPDNAVMARAEVLNQDNLVGALTASANAPTVRIIYPNGGENLTTSPVELRWQGSDRDNDLLTYLVQYSRDNGVTWQTLVTDLPTSSYRINLEQLGATNQGRIRVIASDNFHTTEDTSDGAFATPNHPPRVTITAPLDHEQFSGLQAVTFVGSALDPEDGQLPDPSFTWFSSLDGILGAGPHLMRNASTLSAGQHQITLTVIDSAGLRASTSTTVVIFRVLPPPPVTLLISTSVTSLLANSNNPASIRALIQDVNGAPISDYQVTFHTTLGTIERTAVTDGTGIAEATLRANTPPGTATITTIAGALSASTSVRFVTGPPATMTVIANPTSIAADGANTALITIAVQDSNGNPLAGQTVTLATTLGTVTSIATTDTAGLATAPLTAGTKVGVATVTATLGAINQQVIVTFVPTHIRGNVFLDLNRNRKRDAGEAGVPNAKVVIATPKGGIAKTAMTAANGAYTVTALAAGDYTVTITPPSALRMTTPQSFAFSMNAATTVIPDAGVAYALFLPLVER